MVGDVIAPHFQQASPVAQLKLQQNKTADNNKADIILKT